MWTMVAYVSLFVTYLFLSTFFILAASIGIDLYRTRTAKTTSPIDERALKKLKPFLSIRRYLVGLAICLSLGVIAFGGTYYFFTLAGLVS